MVTLKFCSQGLASTIKSGNSIQRILEKSCIQDFLGNWKFDDGKGNTHHTVLTYAIDCDNTLAANHILAFNTIPYDAAKVALVSLLMEELEVKDETGKIEKYTALSYAEKKGHTDLAERIKQKMKDLEISIPGEEEVDKSIKFHALQPLPHQTGDQNQHAEAQGSPEPAPQPVLVSKKKDTTLPHNNDSKAGDSGNSSGMEDIQNNSRKGDEAKVADHSSKDGTLHTSLNGDNGFEKGNEQFPSRAANNLFWSVLNGNYRYANDLLNQHKGDPTIFQSGWMQILLIGDEEARELAKKDNKNIIKEIQERQAKGIGIIGRVMSVVAIVAIIILFSAPISMTSAAITAIVTAGVLLGFGGFALAGFGLYHEYKEIPSAAMYEVDNERHVPTPTQSTTPGMCSNS